MSEHVVALFDAFTDKALGGSVAAMVDEAGNLTAEQMGRIAREFGAPATCFIIAASAKTVDVRFFSTKAEYPMCGHGTMGLMTWLVERGIVSCDEGKPTSVALRTPAGCANVDLQRRTDGRIEVMLSLEAATFERTPVDAAELCPSLGLSEAELSCASPIELSRSDFVSLLVPINGLSAMRNVHPDFGAITAMCLEHGIGTVALLTTETAHSSSTLHCREFAPALGTAEAPASGTTNRALACYLLRHDLVEPMTNGKHLIISEQGYEIERPSEIRTEVTVDSGEITGLRVGGVATKTMQGQFYLEEESFFS